MWLLNCFSGKAIYLGIYAVIEIPVSISLHYVQICSVEVESTESLESKLISYEKTLSILKY